MLGRICMGMPNFCGVYKCCQSQIIETTVEYVRLSLLKYNSKHTPDFHIMVLLPSINNNINTTFFPSLSYYFKVQPTIASTNYKQFTLMVAINGGTDYVCYVPGTIYIPIICAQVLTCIVLPGWWRKKERKKVISTNFSTLIQQ